MTRYFVCKNYTPYINTVGSLSIGIYWNHPVQRLSVCLSVHMSCKHNSSTDQPLYWWNLQYTTWRCAWRM